MSIGKIVAGAAAFALGASAVFAGTDFSAYVTEGTLTIPAATTVIIDDDNAAAFAEVTAVTFAAKTSQILFLNATQIVSAQTFSGAGKIDVTRSAKLKLTGDNAAYTGTMNISNANVVAASDTALGSADVYTKNGNNDPYQLEFDGPRTTCAKVHVQNSAATFQRTWSDTVTFSNIFEDASNYVSLRLGNVYLLGGYKNETGWQEHFYPLNSSAQIHFHNKLSVKSNCALEAATYYFCTSNNYFAARLDYKEGVKIYCEASNCLFKVEDGTPYGGLSFQGSSINSRFLDLQGFDQIVRSIGTNQGSSGAGSESEGSSRYERIRSSKPALFQANGLFNGSGYSSIPSMIYPFRFQDQAGFVCNIKAAQKLTIPNVISDTTGKLEVRRGTLEFKWKAGWGGTNVVISGGTLICNSPYAITNDQTRLVISSGTLENNIDLHVGSANIGGEELAAGPYTKADYPDYITGDSTLYVNYYPKEITYKDYHWIGGGSDDKLTTKENWQENEAPDFTEPGATLFFNGDTQSRATVEGDLQIHHLVISGTKPFTLAAADENAILRLGTDADEDVTLMISNPSPSAASIPTNVIEVAIQANASLPENWTVDPYAAVDFRGKLSGSGTATLRIAPTCLKNNTASYGQVILSADNSDLTRPLKIGAGRYLVRHEFALGSPTRTTVSVGGDLLFIKFDCLTNSVPFDTGSCSVLNNWQTLTDRSEGLVLNAKFTGGSGMSINMTGLTFLKGLSCANLQANGSGLVKETGVTLSGVQSIRQNAGTFTLAAQGNSWLCWNLVRSDARLKCGMANVLVANKCIHFGEWNSDNRGILDLNGYDQSCGGFARYMYNGTPVYTKGATDFGFVTSAVPAKVTWSGHAEEYIGNGICWISPTNQVKFTGATSLKVASDSGVRHTVVNAKSETKGTLEVASGNLVFAWGAGWTATTNVVVSGGTLIVEEDSAPYAFGPAEGRSMARMAITGTGTLTIVGGQATVRALSTDGETFLAPGVYGSADSGVEPAWQLDCLAGAGTLKVRTDGQRHGMMLYVK